MVTHHPDRDPEIRPHDRVRPGREGGYPPPGVGIPPDGIEHRGGEKSNTAAPPCRIYLTPIFFFFLENRSAHFFLFQKRRRKLAEK